MKPIHTCYRTYVATYYKGLLQIIKDLTEQGYHEESDCPGVNIFLDTYVKYTDKIKYVAFVQKLF